MPVLPRFIMYGRSARSPLVDPVLPSSGRGPCRPEAVPEAPHPRRVLCRRKESRLSGPRRRQRSKRGQGTPTLETQREIRNTNIVSFSAVDRLTRAVEGPWYQAPSLSTYQPDCQLTPCSTVSTKPCALGSTTVVPHAWASRTE